MNDVRCGCTPLPNSDLPSLRVRTCTLFIGTPSAEATSVWNNRLSILTEKLSRSTFSNKQIPNPAISTIPWESQVNQSINLSNYFLPHKVWDTLSVLFQTGSCVADLQVYFVWEIADWTELYLLSWILKNNNNKKKTVGASLPTELHMYMNNSGIVEAKRRPCVQLCNTMYNCH